MNKQQLEERRAFNEALRDRMRKVAAHHGVPDEQMKWLGRLRHEDLVKFVRRHSLDWTWVLVGETERAPAFIRRPALRVIQGGLR